METPKEKQKPLRLSLIVSGAISLGAYEAGVVSQLAYAIEGWNAGESGERVRLDVISGASAGAITSAMLAVHLLHGTSAFEFAKANWDCWCSDVIHLHTLLKPPLAPGSGFLRTDGIDALSQKYIAQEPNGTGQNAPATELILSCALTSLQPIPFDVAIGGENIPPIQGVTYHDQILFRLTHTENAVNIHEVLNPQGTSSDIGSDWQKVARAAVGSAAIPGAWNPMRLARDTRAYPNWPNAANQVPGTLAWINYCDGGVLNNMPLDHASTALSALTDPGDDSARIHILIIPDPSVPDEDAPQLGAPQWPEGRNADCPAFYPRTQDGPPNRFSVAGRAFDAVREQTFYHDLAQAEQFNRRLTLRSRLLPEAIAAAVRAVKNECVQEKLERIKQDLANAFADSKGKPNAEDVKEYLARYQKDAASDDGLQGYLADFASDPLRHSLYLAWMAASDWASDLNDKCQMTVRVIKPSEPLAGDPAGHFGGLVDPSLMKYDFQRGIADAIKQLDSIGDEVGFGHCRSLFGTKFDDVVLEDPLTSSYGKSADVVWREIPRTAVPTVRRDILRQLGAYLIAQVPLEKWIGDAAPYVLSGISGLCLLAASLRLSGGVSRVERTHPGKDFLVRVVSMICGSIGLILASGAGLLLALRQPGRLRKALVTALQRFIR